MNFSPFKLKFISVTLLIDVFNFSVFLNFIIHLHNRVIEAKSFKHGQDTGTVLFERNDYGKQCWTSEEFTILSSRRMFQDILPYVRPMKALSFKNFVDINHIIKIETQYFIIIKTKQKILRTRFLADEYILLIFLFIYK